MVRWLSLFPRQARGFFCDLTEIFITEKRVEEIWRDPVGKNTPLSIDALVEEFDVNEPDGVWPLRELVQSLMWLANQTRPDNSDAVRKAVAKFANAPNQKLWKAARGI